MFRAVKPLNLTFLAVQALLNEPPDLLRGKAVLKVQPFQGLRQSCVKVKKKKTGDRHSRQDQAEMPQQDLANRSENKTDPAKGLSFFPHKTSIQ